MRRLLLLGVCLAPPALAQTSSQISSQTSSQTPSEIVLPDITVTATRTPTLAERIPAGVTIITRETIAQRGDTTLADVLQTVPGTTLVPSGGPGGQASLFVRGTNSNHVLVLRDGIPINDPSDPNGAFNFGTTALTDIERIEVVRGPMSGLYGSGAIGGVINLMSRQGRGPATGTIELGFGLPRQTLANADLSGSTGRFDYALQVGTQADAGFDTTPQRLSTHNGSRNGFSGQTAAVNLGFTPIDGTRVFLAFNGRQSGFNLDTFGYDAQRYRATDNSGTGRAGVTSKLFDDRLETSLVVARTVTDRHYMEPLEDLDPGQNAADSRYHGTRTLLQSNNIYHAPDFGPASASAVTFGAEHILDTVNVSQNTASLYGPYVSNSRASAPSDAGHVGVQTVLWQRLTLTAGGREEQGRYGGGALTWRLGGVLDLPEALSHLKASYGTAFRAPSLYDLFGTDSYAFRGNPDLRPERSAGYELGWSIDLPALGRSRAASLEVTYFNTSIRDLIAVQYAPDYSSSTEVNINRARLHGIEAGLTLRPRDWLETTLTYTYTEARNATDNTRLLRRPKNRASVAARITPLPGLTIAPELVVSGPFQDYLVNQDGSSYSVGRAPGGTVFNLAVTYAINPQFTAFATARNIGGSKFEPAQGFQIPGPSLLMGLRAHF